MLRSTDRIITTHVGSLARPHDLLDMMKEREHGRPYDAEAFAARVQSAVSDVVREQADAGIDVVTDGEMGKVSFFTYVVERLSGYSTTEGTPVLPPSWKVEIDAFPEYYADYLGKYKNTVAPLRAMACTGPVSYVGFEALEADIATLKAAASEVGALETFMPSASPSGFGVNEYYSSTLEYEMAVGEALRQEYLAIIEAGLVLQIDDPWLIELLSEDGTSSVTERDRAAREHIEALNHALRGIPEDQIRLHTCYGLNHGPRVHDLSFAQVAPYMLMVNAGAYSFEVANPRHMHEWRTSSCPTARSSSPACWATQPTMSSILNSSPTTSSAMPRSSGARMSLPVPTAATHRVRLTNRRSIPRWCGRSSGHSRRALAWRRSACGERAHARR